MSIDAPTSEEISRTKRFMAAGKDILTQMDDYRDSLKDLAKAEAEALQIKPAALMKALKIAHKNKAAEEEEANETIESLLIMSGEK